jgi:hypothetical protein
MHYFIPQYSSGRQQLIRPLHSCGAWACTLCGCTTVHCGVQSVWIRPHLAVQQLRAGLPTIDVN